MKSWLAQGALQLELAVNRSTRTPFHLIYGAFVLKRRCELGMGNTVIVIAMLFLKCNKRMPPLRLRHVLFTITLACLISSAPRVTLVHQLLMHGKFLLGNWHDCCLLHRFREQQCFTPPPPPSISIIKENLFLFPR